MKSKEEILEILKEKGDLSKSRLGHLSKIHLYRIDKILDEMVAEGSIKKNGNKYSI